MAGPTNPETLSVLVGRGPVSQQRLAARLATGSTDTWTELHNIDFTGVPVEDWTASGGTGSKAFGGVTLAWGNGTNCSTFGPDGSTGLRWLQNATGTVESGTSPYLQAALSNWGTWTDGQALLVQLHWSNVATTGNFSSFGSYIGLGADYVFVGGVYRSGVWRPSGICDPAQYTQTNTEVLTSSNGVIQMLYTAAGASIYDAGTWSGAFPTALVDSDLVEAIGTPSGTAKTLLSPVLSSATMGIATYRSTSVTDLTIHRMWVGQRQL